MDRLKKIIEAHPELAHLQQEVSEWLKDYESLVDERNKLQHEIDHLRTRLDESPEDSS